VHAILAACPQLKTLPTRSERTAGSKDDAIGGAKHGPLLELFDADMSLGHGVEAGERQDQAAIAARGRRWGGE
jgi:hypothetical protein